MDDWRGFDEMLRSQCPASFSEATNTEDPKRSLHSQKVAVFTDSAKLCQPFIIDACQRSSCKGIDQNRSRSPPCKAGVFGLSSRRNLLVCEVKCVLASKVSYTLAPNPEGCRLGSGKLGLRVRVSQQEVLSLGIRVSNILGLCLSILERNYGCRSVNKGLEF